MKRGFTIIELLVASLLLGMLMTILTMVFNQSSIAWRTGTAGVLDMDDIRDNIAELRDEADNAFIWNNQVYRSVGLWDKDGNLRDRACDAPGSEVQGVAKLRANILSKKLTANDSIQPRDFKLVEVGQAEKTGSMRNYFVNVMSAGPDRQYDTWDDIWSAPDDFE